MRTSSFQFEKKASLSLRKQAYEAIRNAILEGNLKPGNRLRETDISKQMGISRGPLREALRQLEQDGFIISHPYRETIVAELSPEVVETVIVPIRKIIETYAALNARAVLSEEDFLNLEGIICRMEAVSKKDDLEKISELDLKFHQLLIQKAGGHGLYSIWNSIMNRIYSRFLIQGIHHASLEEVVTEHRSFLALLREGNPVKIKKHLVTHIT
jgi:DNA-binding GntR family transcriptional regulator